MFTIIRGGRYGVGVVHRRVQGGSGGRVPPGGGRAVEGAAPGGPAVPGRAARGSVERSGNGMLKHVGRIVARVLARLFGETGTVAW